MISIGQLIDNDGSEKLHYEINSQTDNFNLYTLNFLMKSLLVKQITPISSLRSN